MSGPFDVLYQDRRIEIDGGPYPDPCSTFNVTTGGRGDGGIFADMDRGAGDAFNDCALFINPDGNQPYLDDPDTPTLDDDGRAVVLEFDKGEAGGECVCSELGGRLADPASLDAFMTEYFDLPRTGFIEDEDSCTLAIANGEILTDSTNNRTGNVRISALHPFREGSSKKGKKGSSGPPENASVSIGFHIDRLPGDLNGWRIDSVGFSTDNPRLEITHFDNDPDTKIIRSSNEPFELVLAGAGNTNPICSGFTLPFEMTLRRFTVTQ